MSDQKPKPTHRLVLKHKDRKEFVELGALWMHSEKSSARLASPFKDKAGIEAIKLTDGTVLQARDYFLNIYFAEGTANVSRPAQQDVASEFGMLPDDNGDNIPF